MSRAFGTPSTVTRNDPDLSCVALNEWFNKWWTSRWWSECSSIPWFVLFLALFPHHSLGMGLGRCFPHLNAIVIHFFRHIGAPVCLQSPVCTCLTQLLVLVSYHFLKAPHTHVLLKWCWALWCCYPKCLNVIRNCHCSRIKYAFMINTLHQKFWGGTVRYSFPGPFNTAQPEFFCCKTKLTMLFYIYVFVYTCNVFCCMYVWVWDLWFYPWYAWSMA